MTPKFVLAIGKTYMTSKKCYVAGQAYSEEELGDFKDCVDDFGLPYFVEGEAAPEQEQEQEVEQDGESDSANQPKGGTKVTIGRKKAGPSEVIEV